MSSKTLTSDEQTLYDRQLRTIGVEAQTRLKETDILVVGTLTNAVIECMKNMLLAGVRSVTIFQRACSPKEYQYFTLENGQVNADALRVLNSSESTGNVFVEKDEKKLSDSEFVKKFDFCIMSDTNLTRIEEMNAFCRHCGVKFFASVSLGKYSLIFEDLLVFNYTVTIKEFAGDRKVSYELAFEALGDILSTEISDDRHAKRTLWKSYLQKTSHIYFGFLAISAFQTKFNRLPTLSNNDMSDLRAFIPHRRVDSIAQTYLRRVLENWEGDDINVGSVMGGVMGTEILKVIARDAEPFRSWIVFNGEECVCNTIGYYQKEPLQVSVEAVRIECIE